MFSLILSTFYIIWLNIIHQNIYKVVNSSVALPSQVSGSKLVVQAFHGINYLFPFLWHTASLLQSKTHTYIHQCLGRLSFRYRFFMYRNMATFVNEVCCCILPHHTFNRVIIAEPTWYLTRSLLCWYCDRMNGIKTNTPCKISISFKQDNRITWYAWVYLYGHDRIALFGYDSCTDAY